MFYGSCTGEETPPVAGISIWLPHQETPGSFEKDCRALHAETVADRKAQRNWIIAALIVVFLYVIFSGFVQPPLHSPTGTLLAFLSMILVLASGFSILGFVSVGPSHSSFETSDFVRLLPLSGKQFLPLLTHIRETSFALSPDEAPALVEYLCSLFDSGVMSMETGFHLQKLADQLSERLEYKQVPERLRREGCFQPAGELDLCGTAKKTGPATSQKNEDPDLSV